MDLRSAVKGRWAIAPGDHDVAPIVGHSGLQVWIGCRHEIRHAATHAEPNNAKPLRINRAMAAQEFDSGVHVFDASDILQPSSPRRALVLTVRTVTVVQVRGHSGISRTRDPLRHFLHKIIDATLMLNDHDSRKRARSTWHADIEPHVCTIDLDAFPEGWHAP